MDIRNKIKENWFIYVSGLVTVGALIVVAMISFLSEFGVHPDEYDVRACMDWCMDRWIWPDMRLEGQGLGDTYSGYGYTKVCNYTPYFLIFSKISYVFKQFMDVLPYFRMPNLLLMLFMTGYMLKNLRKRNYCMLGFGICVQAWYIFSYVTADAQDFVLAFLAIVMLGDEDSFLWKTINAGTGKRVIFECIILGLLYGLMLLGKPYYYANLLLTFLVLLHHLIKSKYNNRRTILIRYLLIAGVAFGLLAGRALIDFSYYGTDKASVKVQMQEKWCDPDKNPLTPEDEQTAGWHMMSKGKTLVDMFREEPKWFIMSFRSFAGARITSEGDDLYFVLMALLYTAIYVMMGVFLCRNGNAVLFAGCSILSLAGIAASVINSYMIEIQPQGRYLLPIALTTCYMGSRAPKLWNSRIFKGIVLAAACLSIIYFGIFDLRKLIDLTYVRTQIFNM